ncbi:MAG: ribosome-associated translation inhibitor RaiA [bacterium]|nr:ribosome-associated translation inhibitor RaiA [bacterium]
MQISITGRHLEITAPLREYVAKKIQRLEKYFNHILEVHVILSAEKHRQIAEVNINANGLKIASQEETTDIYASIDSIVDKLERKLNRYKERMTKHRKKSRGSKEIEFVDGVIEPEEFEQEKREPQIIKSSRLAAKPMSIDEAAMQLDLTNQTFLVFLNDKSNEINVIYRRKDGNFGLITRK